MPYKYITDHIPKTINGAKNKKRPANPMSWEYITVHNTGNPSSNARGERAWLINPNNSDSSTSYHFVFDSTTVIECIPPWENAWHAGDGIYGKGNRMSVGIELCESGDFEATVQNAQYLIAHMIFDKSKRDNKRYSANDIVVQHHKWSEKNCPRLLIPRWNGFINGIQRQLDMLQGVTKEEQIKKEQTDPNAWKFEGIDKLAEMGLLASPDAWKDKIDEPLPVWAGMLILSRIADKSIK